MQNLEFACRLLRMSASAVAVAFLVFCSLSSTCLAQDIPAPVSPSIDKMVGAVVVVLPDYEGSDDFKFAGAPLLMYKFTGDRYVQVIGNKAFLNVLNHPNWEAVLKGVYRLGRKKVDDSLVSGLDDVDDSLKLGGFIGYRHLIGGDFRHRYNMHLDITQNVGGGLCYGRMLGDAHNSPVVDDQGSANQLFARLSLLYS